MQKKKYKTWIAVVDSRQARFFINRIDNSLEPIGVNMHSDQIRTNPDSRHSLGRSFESGNEGARHIIEPKTSEWTEERQEFADKVAEYLENSVDQYDRIILTAPPKILGFLRKALSKPVQAKIFKELNKDFAHMTTEDIQQHLGNVAHI